MVPCSLSYVGVEFLYSLYDLVLIIYFSTLLVQEFGLSWPSFCVLRTFFRLFDTMIVSRMISWLYFLMSSFAFVLMFLYISAFSIRCLLSPFSAIFRRFVITARFGDAILDFCGLLLSLATPDAVCWIMSVMISLMVSMSSISCSVSNRFLNSTWNSVFVILFVWNLHLVASWL